MKKLIGGRALMSLGSTRNSNDTDYLVNEAGRPVFFHDIENNTDYINAAGGNEFFAEIWEGEKANPGEVANPQTLLELKAFALVQHCHLGNWQKADDCEYDIKFLVRTFNLNDTPIAARHIGMGELKEIKKIIQSVRI